MSHVSHDFLASTEHCDFNNISIKKLAREITSNFDSDKDKAVALFYWVRDKIPYSFGYWNKKASEVLQQRRGMCTNKAVLLTSLLRSMDIPAGFGVLRVKGQEYFGPIAPNTLRNKVSKHSVHIYSYVFLDDKWFKIDPSVDKELSAKTNYFNPTTKLTEWLGNHDATENLDPDNILEDKGPLSNIDYMLSKKPKTGRWILFKIGNLYLDFLRGNNTRITNAQDQLSSLFEKWMKKNNLFYYILYIVYFKFRK